MLNLKKEADVLEVGELTVATCPICKSFVSHIYFMQDAKTKNQSRWYSCACGVVFQSKLPQDNYDKAYADKYEQHDGKLKDCYEHPIRIYAPLIEELIYGRKVLLVGRTTSHQEDEFRRRGWIAQSIDKNKSFEASDTLIAGDFETHEFPKDTKLNMIWMYHTLECFSDPIATLSKCKDLLAEDGIIYIASPDTDFIHTRSSSGFIHWKPDMHYLMWNIDSIRTHLEQLGFNVILARQNYEHRFPYWDDFHLVAQRKFF
jgi:SAM-dependent methyltransferase